MLTRAGLVPACWIAILVSMSASAAREVDPSTHWPAPPAQLEKLLNETPFQIDSVRGGVGGVMGVKKLGVTFQPSGPQLSVKWKPAPAGDADGWNNTPRKELAAYQIQKWFLGPRDYVVPTIAVRCIDLKTYEPLESSAKPNLPGTKCITGALVIWIDKVTVPEVLYDEARFDGEPLYARHMSDFNLLTYLIEHEDGRKGNFLTSEIESERRIFSIDNGVAFGAKLKNFLVSNWDEIRVPALRAETIERLRKVGPAELQALGVLAELKADANGILRPVPITTNLDPGRGARVRSGWLQLGLREKEIEAVANRLEKLLEAVDAGNLRTF